jgi:hypothetical protein
MQGAGGKRHRRHVGAVFKRSLWTIRQGITPVLTGVCRLRATLLSLFIVVAQLSGASAHVGHLGDVAGHAHWIALGAGALAAALAIAVAKAQDSVKPDADEQADDADDTEAEPASTRLTVREGR